MNLRKYLLIACAFVYGACMAAGPSMNETKTYCVGRFLVDVPADAQVFAHTGEYMYGLVKAAEADKDLASFERRMKQRENTLRTPKSEGDMVLDRTLNVSQNGVIFTLAGNAFGHKLLGIEAYKWVDGKTFYIKENAFDPNKFGDVLNNLQNRFMPSLRNRAQSDLPSKPGFCLKSGFFADDGKTQQAEIASITFKFPKSPGLLVHFTTMTAKPDENSLLQRVDSGSVPVGMQSLVSGIRTLRRGEHDVNGRKGEEGLWSLPTDEGFRAYQFHWESRGERLQPLQPTLSVELTTRDDQRPKLTDEQATRIFESIVDSVRLRPVSEAAKVSDAGDPDVPLYTLVRTGEVAEGDPNFIVEGRPAAFDGHKTTCGATLRSSALGFGID
ncbi:PAAR domain-containing protein [Burkholderia pseudomultivorans]|nr:PAAR domain-containing protein [Burkholderia pseudomultivorans]